MLQVHSFAEVGGHLAMEDAFAVQQHPLYPDVWICVVADGQGGQRGGGRAAEIAVQTAMSRAVTLFANQLRDPRSWLSIAAAADVAVCADPDAGYATLVAFAVSDDWVVGASNGDSAVFLLLDHQPIVLTAQQMKNPPIGSGFAEPVAFQQALKMPWQLLGMTDGVWKYIGWEEVVQYTHRYKGEQIINNLSSLARLASSGKFQDDFTLVVLEPANLPMKKKNHDLA